jgi:hypothetical protein
MQVSLSLPGDKTLHEEDVSGKSPLLTHASVLRKEKGLENMERKLELITL